MPYANNYRLQRKEKVEERWGNPYRRGNHLPNAKIGLSGKSIARPVDQTLGRIIGERKRGVDFLVFLPDLQGTKKPFWCGGVGLGFLGVGCGGCFGGCGGGVGGEGGLCLLGGFVGCVCWVGGGGRSAHESTKKSRGLDS